MSIPSVVGSSSTAVPELVLSAAFSSSPKAPNNAVLRGMVEKGHGLHAISTFLRLDRGTVMDWVVRLDLPTPHDRPLRPNRSPRAWAPGSYFRFIECWTGGWHAASIGEHFRRSAGSVWAKARWLGLPRRERRSVFRATAEASALGEGAAAVANLVAAERQHVVLTSAGTHVPIRKIAKRGHVFWTPELDAELANRYWANQHYEAIAAEWGVSAGSITSRACRLELPRRERTLLVAHYDPTVIAANIAAARYVHRECLALSGWRFWAQRNGPRTSKRGQKARERNGAGYGFGEGHGVGLSSALRL